MTLLLLMLVVDPIISLVRRRWFDGTPYYSPPRKAFTRLAFAIRALSLLVGLAVYLPRVDDLGHAALLITIQFVFSCLIGRYFHNRAHGRAAQLPGWGHSTTVEPDNPEFANDLWDVLGLIAAVSIVVSPIVLTS